MDLIHQALEALRKSDEPSIHRASMRLALMLDVHYYTVEHWRTGRRPASKKSLAMMQEIVETFAQGQRREVADAVGA